MILAKPSLKTGLIIIVLLGVFFTSGAFLYSKYSKEPTLITNFTERTQGLTEPLVIEFDKPINYSKLTFAFSPNINGNWSPVEESKSSKDFYSKFEFVPSASFLPNENYTLKIDSINGKFSLKPEQSAEINFKTNDLPKITSSNIDSSEEHPPCHALTLNFDQPISKDSFSVQIEPKHDFSLAQANNNTSLEVSFKSCLKISSKYTISAQINIPKDDTLPKEVLENKYKSYEFKKSFTTMGVPSLKLVKPIGTMVLTDNREISVQFSEAMEETAINNLTISPKPNGSWGWSNSSTAVFRANESLAFNTTYTITLSGRSLTKSGSYISSKTLSFKTIGAARVSRVIPANDAGGVATTTSIQVTFDQAVDKKDAEAKFRISPSVSGSFAWSGNTMIFNHSGSLQKATRYTITIASGVKSINGLPAQGFSSSFTTQEPVKILNVPYDRQDYALSCEASTLRMALGYYGINVSEDAIMAEMGLDGPKHRTSSNVWGDPNIAYVGDVHGRQNTTGYGVHWNPIARAGNKWRPSQAFRGWSATDLAKEIDAGHPVIIWGATGGGARPDSWKTAAGKTISAWVGEHTWVVTGFAGSVNNPTAFYLHNPLGGANVRWSKASFLNNWGRLGNSGVVVR